LLIERQLIDSFGIQLFFKLYFILAIIFYIFFKFIFNIKILIHFPTINTNMNTNKSKSLVILKSLNLVIDYKTVKKLFLISVY
jgi:hypothetical protein